MGGQIVDATVIEARRPRLTQAENDTIKGGGVPSEWKPARRARSTATGAGPSSVVESAKPPPARVTNGRSLEEQPDRLGVRDGGVQGQPDKPHE